MNTARLSDIWENCDSASELLAQLAHPTRLKILCTILESKGKLGVLELAKVCKIEQANASQFLARMTEEGLLKRTKVSRSVYYNISNPQIYEILRALHKVFCVEFKGKGT